MALTQAMMEEMEDNMHVYPRSQHTMFFDGEYFSKDAMECSQYLRGFGKQWPVRGAYQSPLIIPVEFAVKNRALFLSTIGKSTTVETVFKELLRLYLNEIRPYSFSIKNSARQKHLMAIRPYVARFQFLKLPELDRAFFVACYERQHTPDQFESRDVFCLALAEYFIKLKIAKAESEEVEHKLTRMVLNDEGNHVDIYSIPATTLNTEAGAKTMVEGENGLETVAEDWEEVAEVNSDDEEMEEDG